MVKIAILALRNNTKKFIKLSMVNLLLLPILSMAADSSIKVEYYESDNITNEIPYFDNRFRIDAQIEELTLIFYRKLGSQPIILVQPDGSKIRVNNPPKDKIEWFDDSTFDMIKIKKPMPGPWQAIGDILPNSKIMVVSQVRLEVEPLPEIMLVGETIKITGKLFNGDVAIDNPLFRKVIQLDVDFYSTNNSAYENFGADLMRLTSFRDDGHDLDEYANDNIFTGEFELDFAPGEWEPVYIIKLPMATRELRQKPIIVQPSPITLTVNKATEEGKDHKINLDIDDTFVVADTLVFQGKITFPDKQEKPFFIMDAKGKNRSINAEYTEPGLYRVKVSAFGKTINGREFRLVVSEFTFNVEIPNDLADTDSAIEDGVENVIDKTELSEQIITNNELSAKKYAQDLLELQQKEELKQKETLISILIANIIIIFVAFIMFLLSRWHKKKQK